MPLNFHITNGHTGPVEFSGRDCTINEKDHHKLFRHICALAGGFTYLNHFSEYYKDAFIANKSLSILNREIAAVTASLPPNISIAGFLNSLSALCDLALEQGHDIAALAD